MSINRARIGRVSALTPSLNKTLSAEGVTALIEIVKEYYEVDELTAADLEKIFSQQRYFSLAEQTQQILGQAFLHQIKKSLQGKLDSNNRNHELSAQMFEPIARMLKFSVKYYTEAKVENEDPINLALFPMKHINQNAKPTLEVVATNSQNLKVAMAPFNENFHFDRIMPSEAAAQRRTMTSAASYSLTNENRYGVLKRDPAAMKLQVQQILKHIHGPVKAKPTVQEEKALVAVSPASTKPAVGPYGSFARVMELTKPAVVTINPSASSKSARTHEHSPVLIKPKKKLQPEIKPSMHEALISAEDTKEVAAPGQIWKSFIEQEIETNHLEHNIRNEDEIDINAINVKIAESHKRKVLYSLWDKKVVLVDVETQMAWDLKLAETLELATPKLR
jgi:hypothetical protein